MLSDEECVHSFASSSSHNVGLFKPQNHLENSYQTNTIILKLHNMYVQKVCTKKVCTKSFTETVAAHSESEFQT